jgi:hypothetical protein
MLTASESTPGIATNGSSGSDMFAVNLDDFSSPHDRSRSSFTPVRFRKDGKEEEEEDDEEIEEDAEDEEEDVGLNSGDSGGESDVSSEGTAADPSEPRGRAVNRQVPVTKSTSHTGTTTDGEQVSRILYMQMEFVEKVCPLRRPLVEADKARYEANSAGTYCKRDQARRGLETVDTDVTSSVISRHYRYRTSRCVGYLSCEK